MAAPKTAGPWGEMGPVAPVGVANPGMQSSPNRRIGDLRLPSCCSGNALYVKGLAVWQVPWYERNAECLDNWIAMNGPDNDHVAERLLEEAESARTLPSAA